MDDYTREQLRAIADWKQESPGVLAQTISFFSLEGRWTRMAEAAIPEAWIQSLITGMLSVASTLADPRTAGEDLAACDRLALDVAEKGLALAAAEGVTTGVAGLPGLVVDLPTILGLLMRTLLAMGSCYGFATDTPGEKAFCLAILSVAAANNQQEREEGLAMLQARILHPEEPVLPAMALRLLSRQLRLNLLKRKALQALPLIGGIVGGSVNVWLMREATRAAQHTFQERWLHQHGTRI